MVQFSKPTKLFIAFGMALCLGVFLYLSKRPTTHQSDVIEELFAKKDLFGFSINLESKKPDYLILNFWASWCPPCIEETPSLIRFTQKHAKAYHLFAISQDSSTKDIEQFLKTFPTLKNSETEIIWDDNRSLARKLNVEKLPETFVYSLKQKHFLKISGSTNWDDPEIETYIKNYFESKKK